jgi:hypothetical protein
MYNDGAESDLSRSVLSPAQNQAGRRVVCAANGFVFHATLCSRRLVYRIAWGLLV